MPAFEERAVDVGGGVMMRYRHYRGGDRMPAVCIHGLTRNFCDFEEAAPMIAATGRDVFAVSLRGRGVSDWDPDPTNYHPLVYRDDMLTLLDAERISAAVFVGTSLGGIISMLVNEKAGERVAAVALNDIGPELAPEGIVRISGYVGSVPTVASLEDAAAAIRAINGLAFPDASDGDWLKFARRTFRQDKDGVWVLNYDPAIAQAFKGDAASPDLWAAFEHLKAKPTLLVHGALSDLLTSAIVEKMRAAHPGLVYCKVARVGHAPMLDEPESVAALRAFLAEID